MKFIFVTGGVISSLGKGIAAAALGSLLIDQGYSIKIKKMEPYINIDPGTINPYEHGEVFVTEDGAETDLDLGHYERFTNISTCKDDACSAGQIYLNVINRERKGEYLGKTIQVNPHITDEIKRVISKVNDPVDFLICEIGGTVGDIESRPFFEAIRQLAYDEGRKNVIFIHLTLLPFIKASGELKTKPTQHSVQTLLSFGIQADILLCRSSFILDEDNKRKLAAFCNIKIENVIEALDVLNIYDVVMNFHERNLDKRVLEYFNLNYKPLKLEKWKSISSICVSENYCKVTIVGKYTKLKDTYKSLHEAIIHGGIKNNVRVNIDYINSEDITLENVSTKLENVECVIIPGGYGERGVLGKLLTLNYCREHNIPLLGICLGMQLMCIESLLSLGYDNVSSTEFDKNCTTPVIDIISNDQNIGGTMRLGNYECKLIDGSLLKTIYENDCVFERHRHRYEVNNKYIYDLTTSGLNICGYNEEDNLVEAVEDPSKKFYIGVQYHPEFKSRIMQPHPIFVELIKAAL